MTNLHDLAESRKNVRSYDTSQPVTPQILERVLDAWRLAPSAKNLQPWTFLLVSSPEMLAKIRSCYKRDWFQQAPHILIVTGDRNDAWVRPSDGWNSIETDLGIAMDQLILAAHAEGLATCWISAFDPAMLREALDLKPSEEVFAITPIGYASADAQTRPKSRKPLNEVVRYL
ncbi:MAG TPA: nitroreductase [Chlorobaculum sp.]|uniref:Nitroreductase family protein n=1 Tax=Chlorobaculum tepidum (strain ATCC 49652 / DSM 12025 / NBRC 103806 / TLS) TaxID=194439 RepID=Q8KG48_CHLTE|nr:nitroreductase family protein [Chlorobaculum tepidum]AAM71368.1 nitroreductase family protein [Chlorobaculum tepidum TLS]HBU24379.1 nitroreductase [Chlorobaculum sp.]